MATPGAMLAGARAVAVGVIPLLVLLTAQPAAATPPSPDGRAVTAAAGSAVDSNDRSSVAAAYRDVYLPAAAVTAPAPAADAASRCAAGTPPKALQDATLALVNYVRQLSGVPAVTMNTTYSASAQQAALMMYANGAVTPPAGARCATDAGQDGLAASNRSGSASGASVVEQYLDEAGDDHVNVIRRSRLQKPTVQSIGNGTVGTYNALWVTTTRGNVDGPDYTSWPSSGYFPAPLEPAGRWSLTPWNPDNSLQRATVRVTGPGGQPVSVTMHNVADAKSSLVFEVGLLPVPTGSRVDTYTVTVSNITNRWGDTLDDYTYPVRLFDPAGDAPPAPVQVTATAAPTVTGTAQVGQLLTASAPTWTPSGASTAYAWLRNGTPVPGATGTTYALTADDVGARISVRATGTLTDSTTGTSSSTETTAVTKAPASITVTATSTDPGQAHLVATVSAPVSGVGGTVEVREDGYPIAPAQPLVDGSATVDATDLPPGRHTFTVVYSGDDSAAGATTTTTLTVADAISPDLTVSASSAAVGRLALDVAVDAAGQPAVGGTVSVQEGTTTLGADLAVSAGTARYQGSKLTPGRHTLTVRYSGTSRVKASSTTISTTVKAQVKPVLTVKSASAGKGKVKIAVKVTASGQPGLRGLLAIREGSKTLKPTLALVSGRASWSTSKITQGKHTYTVLYRGTSEVASGSARTVVQVR
ncbi:Ig-like domain repeat protein [uncultured Friedmanniella sp.]|uniref:Ig-like domain repeat protein n=1 Tax=uncultured Friedmanniella sp. TaxID=335381 RepID=UPI0035CA33C8